MSIDLILANAIDRSCLARHRALLCPQTALHGLDDFELPRRVRLLHAQESVQFLVGELIAVLVLHFLLNELVPVTVRKGLGTDHELVPFARQVR